jgi:pyruvate/2-oxoglutarate dehydrogenase complex dihydrolipoamide acyltransferase (E2) component
MAHALMAVIHIFSCFGTIFQAAISGLQNQPIINAVIDGDDIIYRDYVDISIAVGTPKVRHIIMLVEAVE